MGIKTGVIAATMGLVISSCGIYNAQQFPRGRVLIVLTNHSQLGNTGKPTGFYLSLMFSSLCCIYPSRL